METNRCKICGAILCTRNPENICWCHKRHPDHQEFYFSSTTVCTSRNIKGQAKAITQYQGVCHEE